MENLCKTPVSEMRENVILIDWLTVTLHDTDVAEVQHMLGLDANKHVWSERRVCINGYPMQSTFEHITIRWGADKAEYYSSDSRKSAAEKVRLNMGICLDMSGQGCRAFETYGGGDWLSLLRAICNLDRRINITRLDLAYDDHIGLLDMAEMRLDLEERNYVSRARQARLIWSDDLNEDIQGLTLEVGSKSSPVLIRIYNKAAERGFDHSVHWIRIELQLRSERALVAVAKFLDFESVGSVFAGVLHNYLTFRNPIDDTNKSRWPVTDYWSAVIGDVDKISLWVSPGEPYNFSKTEYHLIEQYGPSLITYEYVHGGLTGLISECKRRHPVLADKYQAVIADVALQRELRRKKSAEVRKYYGFEPVPEDDPDYIDICDIFADELLDCPC